MLVVGTAASYGLVGTGPAAAASAPSGGCWAYAPSAAALSAPPTSDVSTTLGAWTTVPTDGIGLTTSGATVVGGTRAVAVTIASGPVISTTDDVSGTASALLSVDGTPLAEPVAVAFDAKAGAPVKDLVLKTDLPLASVGAHQVRLDAVYFDAPAKSLRVACNGQDAAVPSPGANPATTPKPTDVTSAFTAVSSSSVTVTSVADQAVRDVARPGDVVTLSLAGLASSAPATMQLCNAAGPCLDVGAVTTAADGSAVATFTVPGPAPVGAGTLRVGDGTTTVTTAFTVLGVQVVAAAEALDAESTIVTLTGTGWDPQRDLTIRGYVGTDSSTTPTSDPKVTAAVDAAGEFTAEFVVSDPDTTSVIVDQARSSSNIGAVYLISGVIGHGAVGPEEPDPSPEPDPTAAPTTAPVTSPVASPGAGTPPVVVDPPADIPLPGDIPISEPPVDTPEGATVADLSVTEARLDGEATLSELFGGSPRRDLVFLVANVGDQTVENPIVRVSVGRSVDVEPQIVAAEVGTLDPGEQAVVTVPLQLPMAAFGHYHVVGQVGETELGAFEVEWTTYPWGLFALNALAMLLLGWGVRNRVLLHRKAGAAALAPGDSADAVVDLSAADAWWNYRAGTGPRPAPASTTPGLPGGAVAPAPAPAGPHPDEPLPGEAIVDLDAAEKWWQQRSQNRRSRAS